MISYDHRNMALARGKQNWPYSDEMIIYGGRCPNRRTEWLSEQQSSMRLY